MTFIQLLARVGSVPGQIEICTDSRRVEPGDVFVAIPGSQVDGHEFIPQAVANGAAYVVCHHAVDCTPAQCILVADPAAALGQLAQARWGNPSATLTNLAVTGTNGKTTVSYLTRGVIQHAGRQCGMIGTIVYDTGKTVLPAPLTTPDALEIARLSREMLDAGAEYVVMEASSHALHQSRLAGVDFTAAAFTNLTGDHLDYHKTTDEYLAAKMRLFTGLPVHATAVLNKQSPVSTTIARQVRGRVLWYAIEEPADVIAHIESMDAHETLFSLEFNSIRCRVRTRMIGRHNVSNHLAAAGLCLAAGFSLPDIAEGLSLCKAVPGRLEPVQGSRDFAVLVDYAHTDDALRNVLGTLKPLCRGSLILVFGCGGDRDRSKRPRMAYIAEQFADRIFVTSDNPRSEDPDQIIRETLAGFSERGASRITVESDRKKAIGCAIKSARPNDIVLVAGKGHEDYQIIGSDRIYFDDRQVAAELLRELNDLSA